MITEAKPISHESQVALRNAKDDEVFLNLIKTLVTLGLGPKEHTMVCNMLRHKKEGKNWSPAQRSVIASMYYKHTA